MDGITVGLNGGHSGQSATRLTIRRGTTFAYGLGKFKWDHDRKSKRTKVVSITPDGWGSGD